MVNRFARLFDIQFAPSTQKILLIFAENKKSPAFIFLLSLFFFLFCWSAQAASNIDPNTNAPHEIIFIDEAVESYASLVNNIRSGATIVRLHADKDGISQIANILQAQTQQIDAIHIVSHGRPGELLLGSARLNNDSLSQYNAEMSAIRDALSHDGDILLYGCEVAIGAKGDEFIQELKSLVAADIAASTNKTGAKLLGGDWILEKSLGVIASSAFWSSREPPDYHFVLATSENFDLRAVALSGSSSTTYGSFTFTGDGGANIEIVTNGDLASGADHAVRYDGVFAANVNAVSFKTTDGTEFALTSIAISSGLGDATVTLTGKKNGSTINSASLNLNTNSSNGGASYVGTFFGTITFTGWSDVDEVEITGTSIDIDLDDIVVGVAIPANTDPTISIDNTNLAYAENAAATQVDSAATLTDADGDADWNGGTLVAQITANNEAADELSIPDNVVGNINSSGTNLRDNVTTIATLSASEGTVTNGTALTITFNASATNALVQQVLRAIHYRNTSDTPGTSNRTMTFTATDTNAGSANDTRTIAVSASNDAPTTTLLNGDSFTFTEGDVATAIDQSSNATLADVDSTDFNAGNLTVTITSGEDAAEDVLSLDTSGVVALAGTTAGSNVSVSATVVGTLGNNIAAGNDLVVNFNASATPSNVQTLLRSITYQNTDTSTPTTGARNVRVTVNDGDGGTSSNADVTVTVATLNDAPTDIALSSAGLNQSATGVAANVGNLSTTDLDDASFTYTLVASGTAANGLCGVGNDANNASFQISTASFETAIALTAGSYKVCVQTNDGETTFEKTFTISVVDNVGPTFSAVSIPNSTHKVGDTVTATITVTSDADDYTTGLGGISGTINGYTLGSLSKTNNTTYTATFTVTDGGTDVAAASNVAVNFTMTDSGGNTSSAFTTAISQASDAIYANVPTVNLTASSNTLAEDGGTSTLTGALIGSLNNQWPVDVSVNLAYTGTAAITTDYTGATAITIAAGGSTGTTLITSLADTLFDAAVSETIIVDINTLSVGNEGVTNQQTLSITDAESAPTTSLSVGNASVAENGGTSSISATLSNPTYANVTVNLAYSGSATLGGVDANTPSASITILAGATSGSSVTGITAVDDVAVESDESIVIDIASVAGGSATENGVQQQTVTIVDDETVNVSLSVSPTSIAEASGTSTITATLSQVTNADVIVSLGYTGTATDISDYTKTGTITVLTGQTTGSTTITSVTDALAESDETVVVDIIGVSGGNANESGVQQQTVTIVNNASPVNTVLPVISGNALAGSIVSTNTGTWTDAENDTLGYAYQWKADGVDIASATSSSYTVTSAELGTVITVVVSASDGINPTVSVTSIVTAAIDSDFDGDGTGDSIDLDDDNDGMPDAWETANGLDPLDASDASGDLDGDGVNNLDEFLASSDPAIDSNPPVVTPPADITLDATGLFTAVNLGVASASDVLDGALTPTSDAPSHFSPGVNTVTWSATDTAGNIGSATQTVNINPMVNFASDQSTSEGSAGNIRIILNGDAVSYPVSVPYIISGSAATDASDHNLSNGTAIINSGTESSIAFTTVNDGAGEGEENIILTMGTPTNAVAGSKSIHNINIIEGNVAPTVNLSASQSGTQTLIATLGDGVVSVISSVIDPNSGDAHSYDWSATDNALIDTDIVDSSFTFDPSGLSAGFYTLRVTVSDGSAANAAEITLNILSSAPVLTTADSDGDIADDQSEGYGDSDTDGIPEYLDAISSNNVLQRRALQSRAYLLETEASLKLNLGSIAFQSGNGQSEVSMSDITNAGNTSDDARYVYADNLLNFRVSGLPVAGQSVNVVIAQLTQLPSDAIYRNLLPGGWQDFVEDANNTLASAPGEDGYCPPPGDVAYLSGLTEGHWCVQLRIEDGGVNDADNAINNNVVSIGGITEILISSSVSDDNGSDSVDNRKNAGDNFALGSINPLWLTLFGLFVLRRFSSNRKMKI